MKIKWLGHASFLLTSETGTKVIIDPYVAGGSLHYGEINEAADIVTVSHDHRDHNNPAAVRGNPTVIKGVVSGEVKGIKYRGFASYHDNTEGSQQKTNTIYCLKIDGLNVYHLGDLGHPLSDKQVEELGTVDILFIPVGGYYTIDAGIATRLSAQINPKVIIPMHYLTEKYSGPLVGVEHFISGKENVSQLNASEVEFKAGQLPSDIQIIVLKSAL